MPGIHHFFLLLVFSLTSMASDTLTPWHGTCTRVVDGDTLHAYNPTTGDTVKIRLWGLDAPGSAHRPAHCEASGGKFGCSMSCAFFNEKGLIINPQACKPSKRMPC